MRRIDQAVTGSPSASADRSELHAALQEALLLLRTAANAPGHSSKALQKVLAPLLIRILKAAGQALDKRFTPAELDALSALACAGRPFDAWALSLVFPCISWIDLEHDEAVPVPDGRMQQVANCPGLVAAAMRLALDTSCYSRRQQGKMESLGDKRMAKGAHIVCILARIIPRRLLRLPGGSALPAALARGAAAEERSIRLRSWFLGIQRLLGSLQAEQTERLHSGQQVQPAAAALEMARVPGFWQAVVWSFGEEELCHLGVGALVLALSTTDPSAFGSSDPLVIDNMLKIPGLLTALIAMIRGRQQSQQWQRQRQRQRQQRRRGRQQWAQLQQGRQPNGQHPRQR